MLDHLQTLYNSVTAQLKDMRKRATWNKTEMKHIMLMIILGDLIEWSNSITKADPKWYKIRDAYMMSHPEFILARRSDPYHDRLYTNVNTPQSDELWDRIWDRPDAALIKKVDSPKPEIHDFIYVETPEAWVKRFITNNKVVLGTDITGIQTDFRFIVPSNYKLISAINESMLQDSLLDDMTSNVEADGSVVYTLDLAAPLNEPIILTFNHE